MKTGYELEKILKLILKCNSNTYQNQIITQNDSEKLSIILSNGICLVLCRYLKKYLYTQYFQNISDLIAYQTSKTCKNHYISILIISSLKEPEKHENSENSVLFSNLNAH